MYRVLIVDDYTMPRIVFEQVIAGNKRFELAASLPSAASRASDPSTGMGRSPSYPKRIIRYTAAR